MAAQARTEFSSALQAIARERGLDPQIVLETIRQAILAAYRRDARERGEDEEETLLEATVDQNTGEARIFTWEEGKEDKKQDITPPGFGRIAAQTAKQVILQKIREAEKDAIMFQFEGRVGALISGTVLRFDGANVRVDVGRTEGTMPANERIPTERLNISQRLTFLLKEIKETERGRDIILSRADPELVKKLFAREVPEISSGSVEIKAIAREPGARTKIAVISNQSGVDPVGSCVGQKGVRVQAVINELNGEKIDVIPWTDSPTELIALSLAPAEGISVVLNEEKKEAKVKVPEDQLSLAIGREGQNVRLAVHLTGWRIEIEGIPGEEKKEEEVTAEEPVVETKEEPQEVAAEPAAQEESAAAIASDDPTVVQDDTNSAQADDSAQVVPQDDPQPQVEEEEKAEEPENKDGK